MGRSRLEKVSLPLLEDAGRPFPDPGENNKRIQQTATFIKGVAAREGHRLINLTDHLIPAGVATCGSSLGKALNPSLDADLGLGGVVGEKSLCLF